MKKALAIVIPVVLAIILIFTLHGCNKDKKADTAPKTKATATEEKKDNKDAEVILDDETPLAAVPAQTAKSVKEATTKVASAPAKAAPAAKTAEAPTSQPAPAPAVPAEQPTEKPTEQPTQKPASNDPYTVGDMLVDGYNYGMNYAEYVRNFDNNVSRNFRNGNVFAGYDEVVKFVDVVTSFGK